MCHLHYKIDNRFYIDSQGKTWEKDGNDYTHLSDVPPLKSILCVQGRINIFFLGLTTDGGVYSSENNSTSYFDHPVLSIVTCKFDYDEKQYLLLENKEVYEIYPHRLTRLEKKIADGVEYIMTSCRYCAQYHKMISGDLIIIKMDGTVRAYDNFIFKNMETKVEVNEISRLYPSFIIMNNGSYYEYKHFELEYKNCYNLLAISYIRSKNNRQKDVFWINENKKIFLSGSAMSNIFIDLIIIKEFIFENRLDASMVNIIDNNGNLYRLTHDFFIKEIGLPFRLGDNVSQKSAKSTP